MGMWVSVSPPAPITRERSALRHLSCRDHDRVAIEIQRVILEVAYAKTNPVKLLRAHIIHGEVEELGPPPPKSRSVKRQTPSNAALMTRASGESDSDSTSVRA